MADPRDAERRIEHAKHGLDEKLSELQRRVDHTKAMLSPRNLIANPWVRVGLSAVGGFVAGRVMARVAIGGAAFKLGKKLAMVAATSLLREAFEQWRQRQIAGAATVPGPYAGGI